MYQLISREFYTLHYGTHQDAIGDVHTYEATLISGVVGSCNIYRIVTPAEFPASQRPP